MEAERHIKYVPNTYDDLNNEKIIDPSFLEIFNEIICSSRDQVWRTKEEKENETKYIPTIAIKFDKKTNSYAVHYDD